jgi:hypothetical protein
MAGSLVERRYGGEAISRLGAIISRACGHDAASAGLFLLSLFERWKQPGEGHAMV